MYKRWKEGSGDWISLKDSYPVQLANYVILNILEDKPAFAWWVPYVMRKRNAIIQKVDSKYLQRMLKYGI